MLLASAAVARRLLPLRCGGSGAFSKKSASSSATSPPPSLSASASDVWELNADDDAASASSDAGPGGARRGRSFRRRPAASGTTGATSGGFRVLMVPGLTKEPEKPARRRCRFPLIPRAGSMRPSQVWRAVWPAARSFHPAAVPLPVRQGRPNNATENAGISPAKWGNTELVKVPNFLHLTPAHVARHCDAIRHLCTPWPEALNDPAVVALHLPLRVVTTDYVRATSSLRDARARRVEVSISLDAMKKLDERSREKLVCLVGFSSFASVSPDGLLRLWSDRCPWRFQNYDYLMYVLSALYSQSLRLDAFEAKKEWRDNHQYRFAGSSSEQKLGQLPAKPAPPAVQAYEAALLRLHRPEQGGGETHASLRQYGQAVERLLGMSRPDKPPASDKAGGKRADGSRPGPATGGRPEQQTPPRPVVATPSEL